MGTEEATKDMDTGNWLSKLEYEQWVAAPVSGPRPLARYKHAAAVADEKLYVVGGSRNGRYQSDVQVFDLKALSWSMLKPKPELHDGKVEGNGLEETLPAMSDHSMVKWGNKLLILGGHSKKTFDSMIGLGYHHQKLLPVDDHRELKI